MSIQYYTTSGLPSRILEPGVCAVCGNKILVLDNDNAVVEKTFKLNCDHVYPFLMLSVTSFVIYHIFHYLLLLSLFIVSLVIHRIFCYLSHLITSFVIHRIFRYSSHLLLFITSFVMYLFIKVKLQHFVLIVRWIAIERAK
jgi:hypothetical protein